MSQRNGDISAVANRLDSAKVQENLPWLKHTAFSRRCAASIVHLVDEFGRPEHTVSVSCETFKPACMTSSDEPPDQISRRGDAEVPFVAGVHPTTLTSPIRSGLTRASSSVQPESFLHG